MEEVVASQLRVEWLSRSPILKSDKVCLRRQSVAECKPTKVETMGQSLVVIAKMKIRVTGVIGKMVEEMMNRMTEE
jgi:hypothetical protein